MAALTRYKSKDSSSFSILKISISFRLKYDEDKRKLTEHVWKRKTRLETDTKFWYKTEKIHAIFSSTKLTFLAALQKNNNNNNSNKNNNNKNRKYTPLREMDLYWFVLADV